MTKIILFHILCLLLMIDKLHANNSCEKDNFDLSLLLTTNASRVWIARDDDGAEYWINLCSGISQSQSGCPDGTSVCKKTATGESISIGEFGADVTTSTDQTGSELWVTLSGDSCNGSSTYRSIFYMRSGKSMGSPVVLPSTGCDTYFEWSTTAMRKDKTDLNEVKCYVYDGDRKYDLNPLARQTAPIIKVDDNQQFKFSVCKSFADDKYQSQGALYETIGGGPHSLRFGGKPYMDLRKEGDHLILEYEWDNEDNPNGCTQRPHTTITFICPSRGGSKLPRLIAQNDCQFSVEWETEHACAEVDIKSKNTCKLRNAQRGIDFDLTSLAQDEPYSVTDESTNNKYTLNICGKIASCGNSDLNAAACQTDGNSQTARLIGTIENSELKYVDRHLTLTYTKGEPCRHSAFKRETVIEMTCPQDGESSNVLHFEKEDDCSYYFRFVTLLACSTDDADDKNQCLLKDKDQNQYDLSLLQRINGNAWEAITHGDDSDKKYLFNMCGNILNSQCNTTMSSTCKVEESKASSIGREFDASDAIIEKGRIILKYTDGDECKGHAEKKYSTTITLMCTPGLLDEGPVLVRTSGDGCEFEFEWKTAAACVAGEARGDDCRVYDEDLGLDFNLKPLQSGTGYEIQDEAGKYNYTLNVCQSVTCNEKENVATCQTKIGGEQIISTGSVSDVLVYSNGMLKLVYNDGDPYRDGTPRSTQITFICDEKAGKGSPKAMTESDHTYTFEWYTIYACPQIPTVECTARDGDKEYDLSSLSSASGSWLAKDASSLGIGEDQYYISVCGPLEAGEDSPAVSCARGAAVCKVTDDGQQDAVTINNLGKALSGPVVKSEGTLTLTYTDGATCGNGKYSTVITFICTKGDAGLNTNPVKTSDEECVVHFEWNTEAACPLETEIKSDITEQCSIKDVNSDHIFNLMPLRKTGGYSVQAPNGENEYLINVCGNVACGGQKGETSASVCQDSTVLGSLNNDTTLEYFSEGILTLTYKTSDQHTTIIRFICDQSVAEGVPKFKERNGDTHIFEFFTSVACAPNPVDCVVSDLQGNEYDLTGLTRPSSNWEAPDPNSETTKYYINVCAPIAPQAGCPGGAIGGCQVTAGKKHSVGYIQSKPEFAPDGTIIIHYLGGDLCHKGTENESWRSTFITLECSKVEQGPKFIGEDSMCQYSFHWLTPSACPLSDSHSGEDCRVTSEDVVFDMIPFMNHNWAVLDNDHWYLLSVCKGLDVSYEGCKGGDVGVCQISYDNATYINAGKQNHKLSYDGGDLKLNYTGGKGSCHGQFERDTVITFRCDFDADGSEGPVFVREDKECRYYFDWYTSRACPTLTQELPECITYTEKKYDLSSLNLANSNYEVPGFYGGKRFVLNVCGPVVPGNGVTCPVYASACALQNGDSFPIGDLNSTTLNVENEHIVLKYSYTNADNKYCVTEIILICGDAADAESTIEHLIGTDCDLTFQMTTPAACPIDPSGSTSDCRATDPNTGHVFDLNSLTNAAGYTMDDSKGHDFTINVCAPVTGSDCASDVGACQVDQVSGNHYNAGKANKTLTFMDSYLMLNYTDGKPCHEAKYVRNTIIEFMCDYDGTAPGPVFIDETDDCTYFIKWQTELACQEQVSCSVTVNSSEEIDLSPLVKSNGYHIASNPDDNSVFYITLCRELNPIPGTLCPAGSGICWLKENQQPMSLGRMKSAPLYDPEEKKIVVEYVDGSQCVFNPALQMTATIIFICQEGQDMGTPELVSINSCEYEFNWYTFIACAAKEEVATGACTYEDEQIGFTFDFSSLARSEGYEVSGETATYKINPCGQVQGCPKDSAVCTKDDKKSIGVFKDATFIRELNDIKLAYKEGAACGNGKAQAVVLFTCDEDQDEAAAPTVLEEIDDCVVIFRWLTSLACPPITQSCVTANGNDVYDLDLLSRQHGSWNVAKDGKIYYFNLCQSVHNVPGCKRSAAMCRTDGLDSTNAAVLGRLDTQQIQYKDDHVLVTYSGDNSACSNDALQSEIQIHLRCGTTTGIPVLDFIVDSDESCLVSIEWKTIMACKERREELQQEDFILTEQVSGQEIDLREISDKKTHTVIGSKNIEYEVNLFEKISSCSDAAICMKNTKNNIKSSVGDFNTAKYYFEGRMMLGIYTTNEICEDAGNSKLKVGSHIDFICPLEYEMESELAFEYTTANCIHVFSWYTSQACLNITLVGENSSSHGQHRSAQQNVAAIVLAVLFCVLVVFILTLVFKKQSRRAYCYSKVRSIFRRNSDISYRYSQLADTEEGNDRAGLIDHMDTSYGSGANDLPALARDSDDDLIL